MRRYGYVVVAALAALLVSLTLLSTSAQASREARLDVTVNHQVLYAGQSFTARGVTNVPCALGLEWNHVVRQGGTATTFSATYVAPQVDRVTDVPLHATCATTDGSGSAVAARGLERKVDVTVLPRQPGDGAPADKRSADLPEGGAPSPLFLLGGLVLVLVGATAVTLARRRAEDVELPGQTA